MREGDSREEDKEEGRGLGKGVFSFWEILEEEEGEEEIGRRNCFGGLLLGHCCCWGFWARGQETTRIPGAREPKRLFLAGWEVNIQFWAVWERTRTKEQGAKSTRTCRSRYVFY
jgi:hypothetical protein